MFKTQLSIRCESKAESAAPDKESSLDILNKEQLDFLIPWSKKDNLGVGSESEGWANRNRERNQKYEH